MFLLEVFSSMQHRFWVFDGEGNAPDDPSALPGEGRLPLGAVWFCLGALLRQFLEGLGPGLFRLAFELRVLYQPHSRKPIHRFSGFGPAPCSTGRFLRTHSPVRVFCSGPVGDRGRLGPRPLKDPGQEPPPSGVPWVAIGPAAEVPQYF